MTALQFIAPTKRRKMTKARAAYRHDLRGRRFGRLMALDRSDGPTSKWECECDCGNNATVATSRLTSGETKSCGCLQREAAARSNRLRALSAEEALARAKARFLALCQPEPNSGCWLWAGAIQKSGYGRFGYPGIGTIGAHRASVLLFSGPIPCGKSICHRCDNPACVNPEHLWIGTPRDNTRDSMKKGRAWFQN